MPTTYRIFLLLLVSGAALACVAAGISQHYGVVMAGGVAVLLCLAGLAAPLPRGASLFQFTKPLPESYPLTDESLEEATRSVVARTDEGDLVGEMLAQGRYALLLRPQIAENLSADQSRRSHDALDAAMAVVPAGPVVLRSWRVEDVAEEDRHKVEKRIEVEGYYLDRYPVTNREYQKFVDAGGYEQLPLWDEAIWPAMLQFVDRTSHPGPRYWENGRYPRGKEDHPVVGISWFEGSAYARWAGKRLASDAEWVKAATWPVMAENARLLQRKFPWGDAMDRQMANLWGSGPGDTIPVGHHPEAASVGGVQQLIGNVWEWTSTNFGVWDPPALRLETDVPLKSLRGGAFDTYFESQAQSQFQSGETPLARKNNIGFRCAVGICDVTGRKEETAEPEEDDEIHEPGFELQASSESENTDRPQEALI